MPKLRVNPIIIQRSRVDKVNPIVIQWPRVDPVITQPQFLHIRHEVPKMPEFERIKPIWGQVSKLEP